MTLNDTLYVTSHGAFRGHTQNVFSPVFGQDVKSGSWSAPRTCAAACQRCRCGLLAGSRRKVARRCDPVRSPVLYRGLEKGGEMSTNTHAVSRRSFLKTTGALGALAVAAGGHGQSAKSARRLQERTTAHGMRVRGHFSPFFQTSIQHRTSYGIATARNFAPRTRKQAATTALACGGASSWSRPRPAFHILSENRRKHVLSMPPKSTV